MTEFNRETVYKTLVDRMKQLQKICSNAHSEQQKMIWYGQVNELEHTVQMLGYDTIPFYEDVYGKQGSI